MSEEIHRIPIGANSEEVAAVSLSQQIEELDREVLRRKDEYAKVTTKHPAFTSELQFHMVRLFAVRNTLIRLRDSEASNG